MGYDEHGELIPIAQLPPHVARTIAGIEIHTEHIAGDGTKKPIVVLTKKYKFWDKNAALQMGGRYLKMFTDKHEFSASSLEELVLLATTLDQEKAKA